VSHQHQPSPHPARHVTVRRPGAAALPADRALTVVYIKVEDGDAANGGPAAVCATAAHVRPTSINRPCVRGPDGDVVEEAEAVAAIVVSGARDYATGTGVVARRSHGAESVPHARCGARGGGATAACDHVVNCCAHCSSGSQGGIPRATAERSGGGEGRGNRGRTDQEQMRSRSWQR